MDQLLLIVEYFYTSDKVSHKNPADLYDGELSYGPAPESQAALNQWLDKHNRKFGLFIDNNEWYAPNNRKYRTSYCPANKEAIAETLEATEEDVNLAMESAAKAKKNGLHYHVMKEQNIYMLLLDMYKNINVY